MLQFPYLEELLVGRAPLTLPPGAISRWRPLIPVTIGGPAGYFVAGKALLDTGSDDTVFPVDLLPVLGVSPRPDKSHRIRWRGQSYAIEYADVSITLADDMSTYRWLALVTFSAAPLPYPILGNNGCLQYFDARFLGTDRTVELEPNWAYPGTK
jgi:hypothetical protein